jgi:hypothetical protein
LYFVQYRDKKVVGVFVRFRAPLEIEHDKTYTELRMFLITDILTVLGSVIYFFIKTKILKDKIFYVSKVKKNMTVGMMISWLLYYQKCQSLW